VRYLACQLLEFAEKKQSLTPRNSNADVASEFMARLSLKHHSFVLTSNFDRFGFMAGKLK